VGPRSTVFGIYWRLAFWAVLIVWLPYRVAGDAPITANVLIAYAITAFSGWQLTELAAKGRRRYMLLFFYAYTYLFLGLSATAQIGANDFPREGSYDSITTLLALGIVAIGIAAYEIGERGFGGKPLPAMRRLRMPVNRVYLLWATSVVVSALLLYRSGGLEILFESRDAKELALRGSTNTTGYRGDDQAVGAIVNAAVTMPVFVTALMLVAVSRRQRVPPLILIGAITYCALVNNPLANARITFGTVAFAFVAVLMPSSPRSFRVQVLIVLASIVVLFPSADIWRYSSAHAPQLSPSTLRDQFTSNGDYGSFQTIQNGLLYVRQEGFQMGRQFSGVVGIAIPRRLWSDKPTATGLDVAESAGYQYQNLEAPLWLEGYVDGGILFTGLLLGVWGVLARRFDNCVDEVTDMAVFVPALAGYSMIILRGSLMPAVGPLALAVGIVLAARMLLRRVAKAPSSVHSISGQAEA
jgi:hypothetical protein